MRTFNNEQEYYDYTLHFGYHQRMTTSCDESGKFTVVVDLVEKLKSLIGKDILCTIDENHQEIVPAKVLAISPNEIYVFLVTGIGYDKKPIWKKISSIIILDVLDSND